MSGGRIMDDKDLDKDLEKLKKHIPVNVELKQSLRKSFLLRRRNMWIKRTSIIAAALIIVFTSVLIPDKLTIKKVKADAFKISNQISYAEISSGNGTQINEYNGIQYITIYDKGIYRYDSTGYHNIYEGELSSAKLSLEGKRFVISANGNLFLFDIEKNNKTELIKGDNISIFMEEPTWVDENHILYTKKVYEPVEPHGYGVKESSIYEMDINTMKSEKITDGSYPSYAAGKNAIAFMRDSKVIYRSLKDGSERVVDDGRFPDVSPDGKYIAYVKNESNVKKLAENASVSTTLSNVWITDTEDFKLKQQVTFNFVNKYMDENEWLKSLEKVEDKSVPRQLDFSGT
jgi:Tol biopolymer transport system component